MSELGGVGVGGVGVGGVGVGGVGVGGVGVGGTGVGGVGEGGEPHFVGSEAPQSLQLQAPNGAPWHVPVKGHAVPRKLQ